MMLKRPLCFNHKAIVLVHLELGGELTTTVSDRNKHFMWPWNLACPLYLAISSIAESPRIRFLKGQRVACWSYLQEIPWSEHSGGWHHHSPPSPESQPSFDPVMAGWGGRLAGVQRGAGGPNQSGPLVWICIHQGILVSGHFFNLYNERNVVNTLGGVTCWTTTAALAPQKKVCHMSLHWMPNCKLFKNIYCYV